jgi:transposase
MPAERVPMRSVREILRLRAEGLSDRAIARSTRLARSTVSDYAGRAVAAGLSWPLPEGLTDTALEALLFVRGGPAPGAHRKPEPDWASLHRELRRPGVTLMLLWQEYRAGAPEGYGYSSFCELYEEWESRLPPVMRQVHPAGERLFVDYAGQTVELVDGRTGEIRTAQIFVAVLGASSFTYAEATWTQTLPDWIGAHVRALTFFGGVPRQIVPDNLKAGVLKAYGTAILPARPRRPRDKVKTSYCTLSG